MKFNKKKSETIFDPPGPGKCPTEGCENLEDGNTHTGQCLECITKTYDKCCDAECRNFNGGCDNCGDPCI